MKNNKILLGLFTMLILFSSIAYADVRPNIVVSDFSIEGGANVGKDFNLTVRFTNTEPTACAKSITSSLDSGFPFIMTGISTITLGDLCSGGSKTINFPLKVDPTASGGFYQIKVNSNYQSNGFIQFSSSDTLNVFVAGTPVINANIINSQPIDIYPGDTGVLTIKVQNDGSFEAQSISAILKADMPLEVKWSKSFNSIESLQPKESRALEFAVEVPKSAEARMYPLSMDVSYLDENRAMQTRTLNFNIYVKKKAQFDVSDAGSEGLYANQNLKNVKILLKNTGTDSARKIRAKMIPQFPFSTDGSVRYIEMLEAGKSAPIDFTLNVDKDATSGKYSLDMLIEFEDAQGKKFQDTVQVALEVKQKGFIRAVFLDYWFLWLIALAVGAVIYRKRSAKGKK